MQVSTRQVDRKVVGDVSFVVYECASMNSSKASRLRRVRFKRHGSDRIREATIESMEGDIGRVIQNMRTRDGEGKSWKVKCRVDSIGADKFK